MSALVKGKLVSFLVDTGAEVSLAPRQIAKLGDRQSLSHPFDVKSFDDAIRDRVTESTILKMDFNGTELRGEFFVANVDLPIIGADILRDPLKKVGLNTRLNIFVVKNEEIQTSPSVEEAEMCFQRQQSENNNNNNNNMKTVWATTTNKTILPPHTVTNLQMRINDHGNVRTERVFLSLYDDDDCKIFIPSITLRNTKSKFTTVVENKTNSELTIDKGMPIGRVMESGAKPDGITVCAYTAADVEAALTDLAAEAALASASVKTSSMENSVAPEGEAAPRSELTPEAEVAPELKIDGAVRMTDISGQHKVSDEVLDATRENGIDFDLKMESNFADDNYVPKYEINVETEKLKSEKCKFWESKDEFLGQFNLDLVDDEAAEEIKKLLWDFKHIFYNEKYPTQFTGIDIQPVKITTIPNPPPLRKEPPRRYNEEKLRYLKDFLRSLSQQGVIEERTDCTKKIYLAPVVIVIEERYLASEKRTIKKARFCLDQRQNNRLITPASSPLPLTDEFRRAIAADGYSIFSNLDLAQGYYQMKIETEDIDHLFGFRALGRIFVIKRLSMGWASSPSIFHSIIAKIFRPLPQAFVYLDDVTIASKTIREHIKRDLPTALAICSAYNILLKGTKADIAKPEARILGFKIARSSSSLSCEKIEKIKKMSFPTTKKEAISAAAFFSYFLTHCARLSELMAPLRRLAKPKNKFAPKEGDKKKFEEMKEYLLRPEVGVVRMPSADPADTIVIFSDASKSSIGAIICQLLFPLPNSNLDPEKRYLSLVGCWSRTIDDDWSLHPPWLLELMAVEEATRKYKHILMARPFIVLTDNTTVEHWCSLESVPVDLARRIIRMQRFNFRVIFVESRLNPSDWLTRMPDAEVKNVEFPRFLEGRVVDGEGKTIPLEALFSERKSAEAKEFFQRNRRQALAKAVPAEKMAKPEIEEGSDDDEAIAAPVVTQYVGGLPGGERMASVQRRMLSAVGCDAQSIAAFGLDDERVEAGEVEDEVDEQIGEDAAETASLDQFDWERLREVHELQKDEKIQQIIAFIEAESDLPSKTEAAAASFEMRQFFRHRSCFKLSKQKVLYRIWVNSDGSTDSLIVVGKTQFEQIAHDNHHEQRSLMRHVGARKSFAALNRKYFAFNGRRIVNKIVAKCAICKLNNYPRGSGTDKGNQLALEPGMAGSLDCCGPLGGLAQTASGNRRWIVVYVDHHSRFVVARVVSTTADDEILKSLVEIRDRLCGLPARIFVDNALIAPGSASEAFLKEHGSAVVHGIPYISRCQAKCERAIGSLMRLVCKYHTQNPHLQFHRIVAEAVLTLNSTPSEGLGGRLAPKDIFFTRAPSNFAWHEADKREETGNDLIKAARLKSRIVVLEEVKRYMKKKPLVSPTDYTNKIKVGQLCLKKRTSFPSSSPKKMAFKTLIDAYRVTGKIATNHYRVISLIDGKEYNIPGDHLIKMNSLTEDELRCLAKEMEETARKNADAAARMTDLTDDGLGRRVRRSRRIAAREPEVDVAALDTLFRGQ